MTDVLTPNQLEEITHRLQSERKMLLEDIRQQLMDAGEEERFDRYSQLKDSADYSLADVMRDMQLDRLDRESEQLQAIGNAEVRMQKGIYGECIDCDIDIQTERLLAQPTAVRCMQCQEKYERLHASNVTSQF